MIDYLYIAILIPLLGFIGIKLFYLYASRGLQNQIEIFDRSNGNIYCPNLGKLEAAVIDVTLVVGEKIKEGESMVILETIAATMEIPAPVSGEIEQLYIKVGDSIQEGSLLARVKSA